MNPSPPGAIRFASDPDSEPLVNLVFPISWDYLSEPREETPRRATAPVPVEVQVAVPRQAPPASEPPARDQWEMVVPKMTRPGPRVATMTAAAAAPAPAPIVTAPPVVEEKPTAPEHEFNFSIPLEGGRKIPTPAIAAAIFLASGSLFYFGVKAVSKAAAPAQVDAPVQVGAQLPVGVLGWATAAEYPRRISLLRGSNGLKDFRMEFEASIENKAVGWLFRAIDARNYYAMKLETVTPGRDPIVVFKHFAVIDGKDIDTVQIPLPESSRLDAIYKIRVDVTGDEFTTWIQDQQMDRWQDPRLGSGSIGLFSDRGERAAITRDIRAYRLEKK